MIEKGDRFYTLLYHNSRKIVVGTLIARNKHSGTILYTDCRTKIPVEIKEDYVVPKKDMNYLLYCATKIYSKITPEIEKEIKEQTKLIEKCNVIHHKTVGGLFGVRTKEQIEALYEIVKDWEYI